MFSAIVLTLFPEMFPGPLGMSLAGRALSEGIWSLKAFNTRDFATDKHKTVDAPPYGGGAGMVMKADVLSTALDHALTLLPNAKLIYPSPRGVALTQDLIQSLIPNPQSQEGSPPNLPPKGGGVIVLCGRFEGIDQRVIDHYGLLEVSLGDFVLSGGEIAALALLDAAVRLIPGVVGNAETTLQESFAASKDFTGLLEYPHYTRPPDWNGLGVPDVLLSGNHKNINDWRLEQAKKITTGRRPDLMMNIKKE